MTSTYEKSLIIAFMNVFSYRYASKVHPWYPIQYKNKEIMKNPLIPISIGLLKKLRTIVKTEILWIISGSEHVTIT